MFLRTQESLKVLSPYLYVLLSISLSVYQNVYLSNMFCLSISQQCSLLDRSVYGSCVEYIAPGILTQTSPTRLGNPKSPHYPTLQPPPLPIPRPLSKEHNYANIDSKQSISSKTTLINKDQLYPEDSRSIEESMKVETPGKKAAHMTTSCSRCYSLILQSNQLIILLNDVKEENSQLHQIIQELIESKQQVENDVMACLATTRVNGNTSDSMNIQTENVSLSFITSFIPSMFILYTDDDSL